ncbi:nucleoside/nucleotide kinase family protein [Arthrobacter sp. TMN-37]
MLGGRQDGVGRLLVGVDGVDGAGKTIFADALAAFLTGQGLPVVRVSLDDFHHTRGIRHRRGRTSPEGFWLDSYNYRRLREDVFDPLGPGGTGWFRPACHDLESDEPVRPPARFAPSGTIVVIDGMFLHREEIRSRWNCSVFLDVPFAVTAHRMSLRDGSPADPDDPAMRRYVEGQKLYLKSCDPAAEADFVLDNSRPGSPALIPAEAVSYRSLTPGQE